MTAGPPTEPTYPSHEALRARLRDAEETLIGIQEHVLSDLPDSAIFQRVAFDLSTYFLRHADPQEPA